METERYDPNKGKNCLPECAHFVKHLSEEYGLNKSVENFKGSKEEELIYLLENTGKRLEALKLLHNISKKVLSGALLSDVLKFTFEAVREIIPYDRISITFIESQEEEIQKEWLQSEIPLFSMNLETLNSVEDDSFREVLATKKPVICLDNKFHESSNTNFHSTITSPLISEGEIIAIIVFSKLQSNAYQIIHKELLQDISDELSLIVKHEKLKFKTTNSRSGSQNISMICHDLKSPLSIIKGYVDILSANLGKGGSKDEDEEFIQIISRSIQAMFDLIEQAQMYDYAERASLFLKKKDVCLESFLNNLIFTLQMTAKKKNIKLNLIQETALPTSLFFDPVCIRQILENLINNAIKFSHADTTITVEVWTDDSKLNFSVTDEGLGIRPDEMGMLFKPFSKLSTRPTGDESSTGLGLAIVERLVKVHAGNIKVQSELNEGTTFNFSIPLENAPLAMSLSH